jgi:ABC-type nitrate/sulfonate/bicarbonate transport system ATPase subunit/flavin-dependent dehydrogenase
VVVPAASAALGEGSSLRVEGVSKHFPSPEESAGRTHALNHVSLSIAAGELVSLVGPSGCGKSTLLRLIAGLDAPDSGELWVGSELITGPSAERGLVFQDPNLFPWLTVRRNIQAGLVARGVLHEKRREVDEFMRLVGLEAFSNAFPHHLSGGMAQRVALARALINHPKVLLLDEPLGALDAFTRMRMQDEVLRLWEARNTTMLLVTHDIDEAIYMSDRIVIMTPSPGQIERTIVVSLERPRQRNSPEFFRLRGEILELLHFAGNAPRDRVVNTSTSGRTRSGHIPGGSKPEPAGDAAPEEPDAVARNEKIRPAALPGDPAPDSGKARNVHSLSSPSRPLDAQVIIIGGGPAGSTLGAYLSGAGIDHLIVDQAVHPRPHVGESLLCSTSRIFQEIGFLPVMEQEKFVHKHGAVWTHWADEHQFVVRFREIPELGLTQDYTYHVDRGRFDELLLKHAATKGSRVLQGARVERVEFGTDGFVSGVRIKQDGAERVLRCQLVVDASGRSTVLGSQLRLKQHDPLFNQFAVHNWFEGVDRGPAETADYIHIHILPLPRAWVWLILINGTATSVGVVTQGADFVKGSEPTDQFFARHIASHPLVAERMTRARPLHEFTREGNYSYVMDRLAGNGWLLVGDAARFVDPVFSSGVSVALESAKRAADAFVQAIGQGDLSAARFSDYEKTIRAGIAIWRDFIRLYYQLPPLFLDLINRPEARWQLTQLLQGDVYDRNAVPILTLMQDQIAKVVSNPDHPWQRHLCAELSASSSGDESVSSGNPVTSG